MQSPSLWPRPGWMDRNCGPNFTFRRKKMSGENKSRCIMHQQTLVILQSIIVKFSRGIAVYHPRYDRQKWLLLGWSKIRSYFSPFVDQSSQNLIHMYRNDCSLQRRFPVDGFLASSWDISDQVAKLSDIALKIDVFGPPIFWNIFLRLDVN